VESYDLKSLASQIGSVDSEAWTTPAVLVVHNSFKRFVQIDCEILAKHYRVKIRHETAPRDIKVLETWTEVHKHDLVYCWFASWHSFLPVLMARLLGKPAVVVVGGYDVASLPQAGYGLQRGGLKRYVAYAVMGLATHLLPFSRAAHLETCTNVGIPPGKLSVVYLGVAHRNMPPQPNRDRMALTVGMVCRENLLRKGLLPFVQASHYLPDVRFVHAGPALDDSITELHKAAGPNVEFLGRVSDEKLGALYDQASVYVQPSLHEGFGMSVAEAMAAGCIPVVSRCGSLPEVVGDAGIFVSDTTPDSVAEGILQAFDAPYSARLTAQRRIREMFSLDRRERNLCNVLERLVSTSSSRPAVSQAAAPTIDSEFKLM